MKKTIKFKATEDQIQLFCEEEEIITIPKDTLTIEGKQLFDKFISKLDLSTKVEFDYIDDSTIDDANEKRIVTDIKSIFSNIEKKINDKFNLLLKDTEELSDDESKESINAD